MKGVDHMWWSILYCLILCICLILMFIADMFEFLSDIINVLAEKLFHWNEHKDIERLTKGNYDG